MFSKKVQKKKRFERFTIHQIAKINREEKDVYDNTERISLVSSFLCSLFLGDYAPIDIGDASGMNCMDINDKKWIDEALNYAGENLEEMLSSTCESFKILGKISNYFVERYSFSQDCLISAFSGDK